MSSLLGLLEPFDPAIHEWPVYHSRMIVYLAANAIPDERQVPVFLALLGHKAFSVVQDLCIPDAPTTKTLAQLKTIMDGHFGPKVNIRAARTMFRTTVQKEDQSVEEFITSLRHASITCTFGDQLGDNLLDQFVAGLRDKKIQSKLCQTDGLNFATACQQAILMETTEKEVKRMSSQFSTSLKMDSNSASASCKLTSKPSSSTSYRFRNDPPPFARRMGPQPQSGLPASSSSRFPPCYRCGGTSHVPNSCFYKDRRCNFCGLNGHKAVVCRKRGRPLPVQGRGAAVQHPKQSAALSASPRVQQVVEEAAAEDIDARLVEISTLGSSAVAARPKLPPPIQHRLKLNGEDVMFDVDTGSPVTVLTEAVWRSKLKSAKLSKSDVIINSYSGHQLQLLGVLRAKLQFKGKGELVDLYVVSGTNSCLLGRDLMSLIGKFEFVASISHEDASARLQSILKNHSKLFADELGHVTSVKAKIHLEQNIQPIFHKSRPVPLAMRSRIEAQIDRLLHLGVLKKVEHSDWATPIVPINKPDGSVRICADYSVTLNKFMKVAHYPIPRLEELFSTLRGGLHFSKIDLSDAYHQIELSDDSKPLTTINTHQGLYQYERLSFGLSCAPSVFQSTMDTLIKGLPSTGCYFDDILLTGSTDTDHLSNLDALLTRLEERGVRLKLSKCHFFQDSIDYLGHIVDKQGVHTNPAKVKAMVETPSPTSKEALRAFLGLINYYGKFVRDLAARAGPLYRLLHKDAPFKWTVEHQHAFKTIKDALSAAPILAHYDERLPLAVAADASSYGLGAVLFHTYADGTERPICYASRTLAPAERNYSQLEKEALALIFAVHKFHHYLYGRAFNLYSDHKPLLTLLGQAKPTSLTASARIQRWKLFMSNYFYHIIYRPSALMGAADSLSRNPLAATDAAPIETAAEVRSLELSHISIFPSGVAQLRLLTAHDPVLSKVLLYLQTGWPLQVEPHSPIHNYYLKRDELTISDGVILWGLRVVIPHKGHRAILDELHSGHIGGPKMKGLARSYVWWPNIDDAIEQYSKACETCARTAPDPATASQHHWDLPTQPWYRVHVDFAGPMYGRMWLIVVDAQSKYPEVIPLTHATANTTINALRTIFARFGLPVQLVSDNGSQFTDKTFQEFCRSNGINHFRVAPHHPASNGEAERFVQTFKRAMYKVLSTDEDTLNKTLNAFLLSYRRSPHASTGQSPCELLMHRPLRTRLDFLRPDTKLKIESKREPTCQTSKFSVGSKVWVRNFSGPEKWKAGEVLRVLGPATYDVQVGLQLYHRHEGQMRERRMLPTDVSDEEQQQQIERAWEALDQPAEAARPDAVAPVPMVRPAMQAAPPLQQPEAVVLPEPALPTLPAAATPFAAPNPHRQPPPADAEKPPDTVPVRRSTRDRKAVERFGDYDYSTSSHKKKTA